MSANDWHNPNQPRCTYCGAGLLSGCRTPLVSLRAATDALIGRQRHSSDYMANSFINSAALPMTPAAKAMTRAHPDPIDVRKNTWLYVNRGHLLVVHEVMAADGTYIQTEQIPIRWQHIKTALGRLYRR